MNTEAIKYHPSLDVATLPERMRDLPVDERGYPVPWFVDWLNGKPEFRAMDPAKWVRAIKEKMCWVCGKRLGVHLAFTIGPMCGVNRTTSEPPSHVECARWSARNCPFMNNPRMVRRQDELVNDEASRETVAGCPIMRNPGVALIWTTRQYEIFPDGKGGRLIQIGEPESVEWYAEGRFATRAEVLESIESGMPALVALAQQQEGAMEHLKRQRERIERWLPV